MFFKLRSCFLLLYLSCDSDRKELFVTGWCLNSIQRWKFASSLNIHTSLYISCSSTSVFTSVLCSWGRKEDRVLLVWKEHVSSPGRFYFRKKKCTSYQTQYCRQQYTEAYLILQIVSPLEDSYIYSICLGVHLDKNRVYAAERSYTWARYIQIRCEGEWVGCSRSEGKTADAWLAYADRYITNVAWNLKAREIRQFEY